LHCALPLTRRRAAPAAKEVVVGWYSTGPKIREARAPRAHVFPLGSPRCARTPRVLCERCAHASLALQCDLDIHDMISTYTPNPVMVIIDVQARCRAPVCWRDAFGVR
jgi:hypothetical protein